MEEVEVYLEFKSKHISNFVPREYHTFFPFDIQHYVWGTIHGWNVKFLNLPFKKFLCARLCSSVFLHETSVYAPVNSFPLLSSSL